MDIPIEDLKIEIWPPRESKGGQHVGITSAGVQVTHLPSDTVVIMNAARSQHINKEIALDMILTAITHPKFRY